MAEYLIQDPTKDNLAGFRVDPDNNYGVDPDSLAGVPYAAVLIRADDNMPLMVCGIARPWPTFGQCWAFFTTDIKLGDVRPLRRVSLFLLDQGMAALDLRRVTTVVRAANPVHRKWVEFLKFKPEFVLEKAAPDGADLMGYVYWRR